MKLLKKVKARVAVCETAQSFGKETKTVRQEMEEAINAAWATTDPGAKAMQERLFPKGKPTVEEFIVIMAGLVGEVGK